MTWSRLIILCVSCSAHLSCSSFPPKSTAPLVAFSFIDSSQTSTAEASLSLLLSAVCIRATFIPAFLLLFSCWAQNSVEINTFFLAMYIFLLFPGVYSFLFTHRVLLDSALRRTKPLACASCCALTHNERELSDRVILNGGLWARHN